MKNREQMPGKWIGTDLFVRNKLSACNLKCKSDAHL
jgi:hypothetical protein